METIIVDRIEDKQAVCEFSRGEFRSIPLSELPYGVKEGSVLTRGNVCGKWALDTEKEKEFTRIAPAQSACRDCGGYAGYEEGHGWSSGANAGSIVDQ